MILDDSKSSMRAVPSWLRKKVVAALLEKESIREKCPWEQYVKPGGASHNIANYS